MTTHLLIRIGIYEKQQVYFDAMYNKVVLEKEHTYLVMPTLEERKGLIESGLIKIVNDVIKNRPILEE